MGNHLSTILAFLCVPLLVAYAAAKALQRPAVRWGLVDYPGGRKAHAAPTPTIGGLAILLAVAAGLLIARFLPTVPLSLLDYAPLWVALLLMGGVGLRDDLKGLGSYPKLISQMAIAGLVVGWGGLRLTDLGQWPGGEVIGLGLLAAPLAWLGVVGFMNALNMMDGLDGLAGGCVFVMLGWLAIAALLAGAVAPAMVALMVAAAVLGFLFHNLRTPLRRRASVFLGDTGSLTLGLVVIWLGLEIAQVPGRSISPMGIAWVLVLPVLDTLSLMIRRVLRGQNPFQADRNHLHHILGRAGFTPAQSAAVLILLSLALGGVGVIGSTIGVPDIVLGIALVGVAVAHYLFVRYAWRSTRALRRLHANGASLSAADRLALGGLYLGVLGLSLAALPLLWLGLGLVALATLGQFEVMWRDLKRLPLTWLSVAVLVWLTAASLRDPALDLDRWAVLFWASGVLALPLGWWFAQLRTHAPGFFATLIAGVLMAWSGSLDWPMLEAGSLRTAEYWQSPPSGELLLVMMLMPLIAGAALSLSGLSRRWRARALLGASVVLILLTLTLLLGSQSRVVILAGLVGLITMLVTTRLHHMGWRLWAGLGLTVMFTLLAASLLANGFKPPGVSLNDEYLAPLQAGLLMLAGEPELAQQVDRAVFARLDDWGAALAAMAERPLAGWGRVTVDTPSLYAVVGLTGGFIGLGLFVGLLVLTLVALGRVGDRHLWPSAQMIAAHGIVGTLAGYLLLSSLVVTPLAGVLFAGVIALGVAAAVQVNADKDQGGLPASTPDHVVSFSRRYTA